MAMAAIYLVHCPMLSSFIGGSNDDGGYQQLPLSLRL